MPRKIEWTHAGAGTSGHLVRRIRSLVCPSCDAVDVEVDLGGGAWSSDELER
ncbi:MAG: hypothetical protein ABIV06_08400 [Thermoanaerobaculia bacterium]